MLSTLTGLQLETDFIIRLLLIACDSGTEIISGAVFTSFGGILPIQEEFLM